MNTSIVTVDRIFIGCRDRRIFIFNKSSFELAKMIEVPESIHSMCSLEDYTKVAVGMSDGHVLILGEVANKQPSLKGTKAVQINNVAQL